MAWPNLSVSNAYAALISSINTAFQTVGKLFKDQTTGDYADQVRYNSNTKRLECWTGSAWSTLDMSGTDSGTAATLKTARTIGGVSFNGSANINLPGVNQSGNQDTSGNAATATKLVTARNIGGVSFDGSADISLPGVNEAGNQDTSGASGGVTVVDSSKLFGFQTQIYSYVQTTSKSTSITISSPTGFIEMNSAALAANTSVSFTVFNSINRMCIPVVSIRNVGLNSTGINYTVDVIHGQYSNYFVIRLKNISAGSLSETVILKYALIDI